MESNKHEINTTFLVVGGGIAGVTCAETLVICAPEEKTVLLTESNIVKTVSNLEPVARYLEKFDVMERNVNDLNATIITIVDTLKYINTKERFVLTKGKRKVNFKYLCLCTGGKPHLFTSNDSTGRVIGIRDTDSVIELQNRLKNANSLCLVGNGGIASELAFVLRNVEVHWVIKDNHIARTFVDPGAAAFLLNSLDDNNMRKPTKVDNQRFAKRLRYDEMVTGASESRGAALGPDWLVSFGFSDDFKENIRIPPILHYGSIIQSYELINNQVYITLAANQSRETIKCDFIVSATGVEPRVDFEWDIKPKMSDNDGIAVDEMMATNLPYVYAAGDVCTADWQLPANWFQMRLWTQARQMGSMAGRSMAAAFQNEIIYPDFCFELFGHVTELFGFPVVLLGLYNAQGLGNKYEIIVRVTKGKEFIKFVTSNGRLRGAILIGDIDLAETCENLILDEIDLTPYGDDLLNPNIDIEDFFD